MDYHKLITAFINNGLNEKDAFDAAYAYRNCELMLEGDSQEDYDKAVHEEISCWEV